MANYGTAKIVIAAHLLLDERSNPRSLAKAWDEHLFAVAQNDVPQHIWDQIIELKKDLSRYPGSKHFTSAQTSVNHLGWRAVKLHRHRLLEWAIEMGQS